MGFTAAEPSSPDASPGGADPAAHELWRLMLGFLTSQALIVAAQLRIADVLGDDEVEIHELASACGARPAALRRVLCLLTAEGIFTEPTEDHFVNNRLSQPLRRSSPSSQADFARFLGTLVYPAAAELTGTVRTGTPAFELAFGQPLFTHLATQPDHAEAFTQGMAASIRLRSDLALDYPWPRTGTVVDVGGADGTLLTRILAEHAELRGIVVDLPHVEPAATGLITSRDVAARCHFVGADFFDAVPSGGDIYLLSAIIHDWDDASAVRILRNCREAMHPEARLLLIDAVLPDIADRWTPEQVMDVVMLVLTTGRERREREWRALLDEAGFTLGAIASSWRVALLEAHPTDSERS